MQPVVGGEVVDVDVRRRRGEPAVAAKRAGRGHAGAKKKPQQPLITVRHMTRRDINRVWDFLKISFREVNAETVEYQRPRSKHRFEEVYEEEGIEQLVFEVEGDIVAYAECSYEVIGSDNWINQIGRASCRERV